MAFNLLVVALCWGLPVLAACQNGSTTVNLRNGTVVGVLDEANHVQSFLGVPYAEPPVGDLRLTQARPLESSFGHLAADTFGASCYGSGDQPNASEDCLSLNIWRPVTDTIGHEALPVLVWFYGGGLTSGYTVRT